MSSSLLSVLEDVIKDKEERKVLRPYRERARPSQLPPEGDWFCWLILAGRGWGKTWVGANWVVEIARSGQYPYILIGGRDLDNILGDMVYGESGIMNQAPPDFKPTHQKWKETEYLLFPNGTKVYIRSPRNPGKVRGMNLNAAWVDEACSLPDASGGLEDMTFMANLLYALRKGKDNKLLVTSTPQPVRLVYDLMSLPRTVVVTGSSYENEKNLSNTYKEIVLRRYENTRAGQQEIYGKIVRSDSGWDDRWIRRSSSFPPMDRVAIGLDPMAGSESRTKGEVGIVVVGSRSVLGYNEYWVLEDCSLRASPNVWASRVSEAYRRWNAECVVVERNVGGDLVSSILLAVDPTIVTYPVWAHSSKVIRAEPIRHLYERGFVFHLEGLEELERQMLEFPSGKCDRVDALVWALLYLSSLSSSGSSVLTPDMIMVEE